MCVHEIIIKGMFKRFHVEQMINMYLMYFSEQERASSNPSRGSTDTKDLTEWFLRARERQFFSDSRENHFGSYICRINVELCYKDIYRQGDIQFHLREQSLLHIHEY